jgi:hypothetical protein
VPSLSPELWRSCWEGEDKRGWLAGAGRSAPPGPTPRSGDDELAALSAPAASRLVRELCGFRAMMGPRASAPASGEAQTAGEAAGFADSSVSRNGAPISVARRVRAGRAGRPSVESGLTTWLRVECTSLERLEEPPVSASGPVSGATDDVVRGSTFAAVSVI